MKKSLCPNPKCPNPTEGFDCCQSESIPDLFFIQCKNCGTVVSAAESFQMSRMLANIIDKLDKLLDVKQK